MTIIRKSTNNKCWRAFGEKETLLHCRWECKLLQSLWKTVRRCLKKTKYKATIWSSSLTPEHIIEKDENSNSKRHMHPNVYSSSIYNSKTWAQPKCLSTDNWFQKIWHIHIKGFPGGSDGKASAWNVGDPASIPGLGRFPWRRKWQPTPVLLPRKLHGWRSLVGYSPWGRKESDTTERLHFHLPYTNVSP